MYPDVRLPLRRSRCPADNSNPQSPRAIRNPWDAAVGKPLPVNIVIELDRGIAGRQRSQLNHQVAGIREFRLLDVNDPGRRDDDLR